MIYWSHFSWEAFATLAAGLAAVGAAWWVGRNQLEIQRRQLTLIENDLKIQLLEKRSVCVDAMRQISNAWHAQASLSDEEWARFRDLFHQAQLLYPNRVIQKLDNAVSGIFRAKLYHNRSMQYYQRSNDGKGEEFLESAFAAEDKVMKIMPDLLDELINHTRVDAWQ